MDDVKTIGDFLMSLLPEALLAKALGSAGVVTAVISLLKKIPGFEAQKKIAAPLAGLVLGQVFGFWAVNFDMNQALLGAGSGLMIFLVATGAYSVVKNVSQGVRQNAEAKSDRPAA